MDQHQQPKFVISASEAESMLHSLPQSHNNNLTHLLPSLVKPSLSLPRAPISNFPVAAVGIGPSGRIFIGVNIEFPGLPLHHSIHAEQFLVTNLSLHSEPQLLSFAVSAAPCGHCRQFLQELPFAPDITLNILDNTNTNTNTFTPLSHFLSHHFGPHDLLPKDTPLLLQHRHNNLTLITATHDLSSPIDLTPNGFPSNPDSNSKFQSLDSGYSSTTPPTTNPNNNDNNDDKLLKVETLEAATSNSNEGVNGYAAKDDSDSNKLLKEAALEAANKSHAPYSGSPSGVALMDNEGKIYKGSYLESAAYNPSLGPVQTALVAFVAGGGGGYDQIVEAVLVEKDGAIVKQEQTARLLLHTISPNCHFSSFLCFTTTNQPININ